MADTKTTALATLSALTDTDLFPVVDDVGGTPVTNSLRADSIKSYLQNGGLTMATTLSMADNTINGPRFHDYQITSNTVNSSSGVLTIDMSVDGNSIEVPLTENITSIVIDNPPSDHGELIIKFTQNASSAYTITYGGAFLFKGGTHHVMTTTLSAVDLVNMITWDGGSNFYCTFVQAFS